MESASKVSWEQLREYSDEPQKLQEFVASLSSGEAMRALLHLNQKEQQEVLMALLPAEAADLIEDIPAEPASNLIEGLPAESAASILEELDSDTQVDLLQELDDEGIDAILAEMEPETAAGVRTLAEFAPDSAGGLMRSEVLKFGHDAHVGDVLDRFVEGTEDFERYRGQHPYLVDRYGRLVGVISLRNLLLSGRYAPLIDIMTPPVSVSTSASLDDLEELFEEKEFLGVPVVGDDNVLLGVVSRSAVAEAIRDRADSDQRKRVGIVGDELRSMPLRLRSGRRLSWLSINILLNIIAASVIAFYEQTLAAVIALAVFLPIVSDMSGCSGNQAVAVSLRELTLGVIKPTEFMRVLRKEAMVGIINGIALGVLLGTVAYLWKGNLFLGLVVGGALAANTVIAVSIGGTVPLLLKHFGVDPAVASGPILTTVTDMAGFFLVLSIATLAMPLLAQV